MLIETELGRSDSSKNCQGTGERFHGTFANNPKADFGFVTLDYRDCSNQRASLLDVVGLEVRSQTIVLVMSGGDDSVELTIEQVVSTASPGVLAYIVKNTVDGQGSLAAIVKSPIRKIGALVFRTKDTQADEAITLLEDIITK